MSPGSLLSAYKLSLLLELEASSIHHHVSAAVVFGLPKGKVVKTTSFYPVYKADL